MRISVVHFALLGAALAAPMPAKDESAKPAGSTEVIARDPTAVAARGAVFIPTQDQSLAAREVDDDSDDSDSDSESPSISRRGVGSFGAEKEDDDHDAFGSHLAKRARKGKKGKKGKKHYKNNGYDTDSDSDSDDDYSSHSKGKKKKKGGKVKQSLNSILGGYGGKESTSHNEFSTGHGGKKSKSHGHDTSTYDEYTESTTSHGVGGYGDEY